MSSSDLNEAILKVKKSLSAQIEDVKITSSMSSLMLSVCLIDSLAGFYCGFEGEKRGVGMRFEEFTKRYLPDYSGILYKIRCDLVHSFTNTSNFMFFESSQFSDAFPQIKQWEDMPFFDLPKFKNQMIQAFELFFEDVGETNNQELRDNFMNRYKSLGIISDSGIGVIQGFDGNVISHIDDLPRLPGTNIPFGFAGKIPTKK